MIGLVEFNRVFFLINVWLGAIKSHNAVGFTDINKVAEGVVLRLLNETCGYNLENLEYENKNYPGIDLGDKSRGVAFQVTSRKDTKKIKENLTTFVEKSLKEYPKGIRFFLLSHEKKPRLNKEKYKKIYPGFDPVRHIFNADDLARKIKKIYDKDKNKFYRIKEVLEEEIAGKLQKKENIKNLLLQLFKGSKQYNNALRGPNGRFKHLDISDIILANPKNEWIDQQVAVGIGESNFPNIMTALPNLWKKDCPHAVILGEGGMGKTVSLIRLWEEYLKEYKPGKPVPVFIQLNEYNQAPESERKNFIASTIRHNYLDHSISIDDIREAMKITDKEEEDPPSIILLLDGFNEITIEKTDLLIELGKIIKHACSVQVVISSRYDMRVNFNWNDLNLLSLQKLEDDHVRSYLKKNKTNIPEKQTESGKNRLFTLIKNPMMLTLYSATCEVLDNRKDDRRIDFKKTVETPGELLWNFTESQVAKFFLDDNIEEGKKWFYKFLLKLLLPAIGFEMEKAGQFSLSWEEIKKIIENYFARFSHDDFFDTFPAYEKYENDLRVGEFTNRKDSRKRRSDIIEIICKEMCMMVEEQKEYRFLHQNFRDFFAANHILNEIHISLKKNQISDLLKERALPVYIRRYIGEIEGEHYAKPTLIKGEGWKIEVNKENRLHKTLDLCRGIFDKSIGFTGWNIIETWKDVRGELSGADLSYLDLSNIIFNDVLCSRFYNNRYLITNFNESLLHEKNLFSQGHSSLVRYAIYSADEKKILSTAFDNTIKEWDVASGECLKTLREEELAATIFGGAVYHPDGKRLFSPSWDHRIAEWNIERMEYSKPYEGHRLNISNIALSKGGKTMLSPSADKTIKEWDIETKKCIKTFSDHKSPVYSAVYCPHEKYILSASGYTVKIWNRKTAKCIKTFEDHSAKISGAVYHPDGKKVLSCSHDRTIKEWDVSSGRCINTYRGHTDFVVSAKYSPKGEKILSASNDCSIKEWDSASGECLQTFRGHSKGLSFAVYNSDATKILSCSVDQSIKEWDVESGECIRTTPGDSSRVWCVKFSSDGQRILAGCQDGTIKEWDIKSQECIKTFYGHSGCVRSAIYSPDQKKILSASDNGAIIEWDMETGRILKAFLIESQRNIIDALYDSDGSTVIASYDDGEIEILDFNTGRCIKSYTFEPKMPNYNSKSIHENTIAEASGNKIKISKIKTKEHILTRINISGFFMLRCSFKHLHKDSQLSDLSKAYMKQYGVTFE